MYERAPVMSVLEARELAFRSHGNQRDRDGSLHIDHVARVAESVSGSEAVVRVAWLHDVLEDCDIGIDELRPRLPQVELDALLLLTHEGEGSYEAYIERLVQSDSDAARTARAVKEADMLDNLRRCAVGRDPAIARYGQALGRLWSSS
jgi:(p)ppGpp synthase/HD superfamily hydrolase